jgi:hypothetical protein
LNEAEEKNQTEGNTDKRGKSSDNGLHSGRQALDKNIYFKNNAFAVKDWNR